MRGEVEIFWRKAVVFFPMSEAELHMHGAAPSPRSDGLLNLLFKSFLFSLRILNKTMPIEVISLACSCMKTNFHIWFPVPSVDAGRNKAFLNAWRCITVFLRILSIVKLGTLQENQVGRADITFEA